MKTVARFDYMCDIDGFNKNAWRHMLDHDEGGYIVSWWIKKPSGYTRLFELPPTGLDQAVKIFLDYYKSKRPTPEHNALTIQIKDDTVFEAVKRLAPIVYSNRACQSFDQR